LGNVPNLCPNVTRHGDVAFLQEQQHPGKESLTAAAVLVHSAFSSC